MSGPITHLAYGHYPRAGSSLLLRLGVTLGAAIYSMADCEPHDPSCGKVALVVGGVGMLIATVVDGAVLANDRVRRRPPRILPTLSADRNGAMLGAIGTF